MKNNDFDRIALIYDSLSKLIFQKSIFQSQLTHLNKIPTHANILIIGGGTGLILNEILSKKPEVQITYIELSKKMLKLSQNRLDSLNAQKVRFIHGDEKIILGFEPYTFDIIITNFFLDVFSSQKLLDVMQLLNGVLVENGLWINTDFVMSVTTGFEVWKKWLIKFMYLFFNIFCNLEGKELLDLKTYFHKIDLPMIDSKSFFLQYDPC